MPTFFPLAFEIEVISIQDQCHWHLCTYPHLTCKSLALLIIHFSRFFFFLILTRELRAFFIFFLFLRGYFFHWLLEWVEGWGVEEKERTIEVKETHWLFAIHGAQTGPGIEPGIFGPLVHWAKPAKARFFPLSYPCV